LIKENRKKYWRAKDICAFERFRILRTVSMTSERLKCKNTGNEFWKKICEDLSPLPSHRSFEAPLSKGPHIYKIIHIRVWSSVILR